MQGKVNKQTIRILKDIYRVIYRVIYRDIAINRVNTRPGLIHGPG